AKRILKTLSTGDFFGEMALIHNAPRAATVEALTDLIVLELDKEGFDRILKHSPSVSMAMVQEISSRLRQNDQLAIDDLRLRAQEVADAYQKLAEQDFARQAFLSTIAHELRTPLMVASGYLHALKKGMLPADQMDATIDTVARNVDRIVTLTNDLLFLQEVDLVLAEFQPVNIVDVVRQVVSKIEEKARGRQITIKVVGEGNVPPVQGDIRFIERAITALVDNAIKFSGSGSQVEIRFLEQGEYIKTSVEDHGIGIAPEMRARIFDRFVRHEKNGDELYGGLGLGLSIARQVIQQHKGSLEVESEAGQGSTFTISLLKWK
ncbi:MAG: HAMP domain-containing sensor histidine kinase, partial [Anaerolineales bacterium]|nr:HAMP domain-containing sensor histidine kinase [Anaerolineales bacterium]